MRGGWQYIIITMNPEQYSPLPQEVTSDSKVTPLRPTLTRFELALESYDIGYHRRHHPEKLAARFERFVCEALNKSGIFSSVTMAPGKIDEQYGIDVLAELPSGAIIGIDATLVKRLEQHARKYPKIAQEELIISGLERYGIIPAVPLSLQDWEKHITSEGKLFVSQSAVEDILAELQINLDWKMQERMSRADPADTQDIQDFYTEIIDEINELVQNKPKDAKKAA